MIKPATAAEIPEEQEIFTAAWNYLKQYANLKQTDDDRCWHQCSSMFSQVFNMGTSETTRELSSGLATAVFKYIEARSKVKQ